MAKIEKTDNKIHLIKIFHEYLKEYLLKPKNKNETNLPKILSVPWMIKLILKIILFFKLSTHVFKSNKCIALEKTYNLSNLIYYSLKLQVCMYTNEYFKTLR